MIGGHQVRNVATVGGNIVNASPAADLVPVLLALDATVDAARRRPARGRCRSSASSVGAAGPARRPDELLTARALRQAARARATAFLKAGRRKAMEISVICVAAHLRSRGRERCLEARIAIGAVAPAHGARAARRSAVERRPVAAASARPAAAAGSVPPIDDVRASARYRKLLVATLVERALARCADRMAEGTAHDAPGARSHDQRREPRA